MNFELGKEFTREDGKTFILTKNGLKEKGKKFPSYNYEKSVEVLQDPALFAGLSGSAFNYADNVVMGGSQGHGFAGEKLNNMYDTIVGKDATIVGGDNAKNGADRLVDGVNIQTKYCKTGSRCVNECFADDGIMKYINPDGTPMQIEVPSDKYQDAIQSMEDKIRKGKVPGVSDPKEAQNIIKRGEFTYQQAINVAKFGTVESLTFDAVNGLRLAGTSMGISSVISFSVAIWNGDSFDKALKSSIYSGLKVGGVAWAGSILAAQLGRTGLEQALRGTTDYIVKSMGKNAYHFLANGLRSSGKIYGAAAINNVSKVLRGNVVTAVATTVVMSVPDFYRLFNGKVSGAQVFKNVTKTGAGVAGGVGGWMGGAAAGAAVGSAVPILGTAVGGIVGGLLGSFAGGSAGSKVAEVVLDEFIEDDAKAMMSIVEDVFATLAFEYILNQEEANNALSKFTKRDVPELLRNMYASSNSKAYATRVLESIIETIVKQRPQIKLPSNQKLIEHMGEVIDEMAS
ncbi:hypothetical protein JHD48_05685 [Sulfurimonas sp. SAG-AH-194-I05]|nr:hypothetical protein [Sulfurimonas sp. SAG-AH-194-I05]MDF1875216.1 hypothetical protein [Sulfurimonas sp. SAG-AH-194-I05]